MFLSFIAYILIPIYTLLFVEGTNWFTTNFSVVGNMMDRSEAFILWGLIVGIYFYYCLRSIVSRMTPKPKGRFLIPASLVLLTFALTTPYLPDQFPFKSFLHIIFAFMAAVCLLLCLYLIVWQLYRTDRTTYRPYLISLIIITLFSSYLFILAGIVSSALEIFFSVSSVVLVRQLLKQIRGS